MDRIVSSQPVDGVGVGVNLPQHIDAPAIPVFDPVKCSDITMVFCVRLHDDNSWIADRLDAMADYYQPCPEIVIVDFGSEPSHAQAVAEICNRRKYRHHFVPDFDVFSLATARNIAFEQTTTDFVFFCDPDFVSERDLFEKLARNASALNMRRVVDIILNPPAVHLNEADTRVFEAIDSPDGRSSFLNRLSFALNYAKADREEERFIAPYSNVFLINRKMFSLAGGYDSSFRGHGSEDFEFLLRFCIISGHLPLPDRAHEDLHGPLRNDFFQARPYAGFRRLFELLSQPTEGLGLKVFHLYHHRERNNDWYSNNDWKRDKFSTSTGRYLKAHHSLLSVDHLPRRKKIACLCKNTDTWGYFLPLRLAGYATVPVFDDKPETLAQITDALISGEIDDVAIFNPYMKSHAAYRGIVMLAREKGRNVVVIERGALPGTIYYDDDVCYNSPNFSPEAFRNAAFSRDELTEAEAYIRRLRLGDETLESMDAYAKTAAKYSAQQHLSSKICFIPLQLEDDMAVTMFIKGEQSYSAFVESLGEVVEKHRDLLFIIKPHPLSKVEDVPSAPNVTIADRNDNVHFLLDLADVTLCYNSGVGLLSILHETPTITLGNAFYNIEGAGYRARSAAEGLDQFVSGGVSRPQFDLVRRLAAWFISRKYSQFIATDSIREFATRKAHGYRDISVTKFLWREHHFELGRMKVTMPFSWASYAAARIAPVKAATTSKTPPDGPTLIRWGLNDFHRRDFEKSAKHLIDAHKLTPSRPNLLRYAAEAYYQAGKRAEAIKTQRQAIRAQPNILRAKMRLCVLMCPPLKYIIGNCEMTVPRS
jgi:predicted glycosyltransferase involved in capsule biosynthesis/tetratricopeptide (TPR) repeat protein